MRFITVIFCAIIFTGCSTTHEKPEHAIPLVDENRIISSNYDLMRTLPSEDYERLMKEYYPYGYCGDNCTHTPQCGFYMDYETGLIYDKPMKFK